MNNKPVSFSPATTKRASEVIYEQIYQKIASGELKAGDRLPAERELAEQFHRSRPSIREALRMLQQDGIIQITVGTNGGAVVQGITLESAELPLRKLIDAGVISLQELVDYRVLNDRNCAELALRYRTEEDLERLREIMVRYRTAIPDSDVMNDVDIEFHQALAKASHNQLCILMSEVVTSLCTSLFWKVAASDMDPESVYAINQAAYDNHMKILHALETRDLDGMIQSCGDTTTIFYNAISSTL